MPKYTPEQAINTFWSNVNKDGSIPVHCPELGKCWEWTKSCSGDGYGNFYLNGKLQGTHRISWQITFGEIPDDLWVLHKCDNQKCCNPKHLFLGSHQENMDDMIAKGRGVFVKGEQQGLARLTSEQVCEIRQRFALGGISKMQLARDYSFPARENHLL